MINTCYYCKYKERKVSEPNNLFCITCPYRSRHNNNEVTQLSDVHITGCVIANYDIKNVIFNLPATIVFWADGTKTVVKAHGEEFDPEKGLAMAISKKALGTGYYPEIKKWTEKYHQKKSDDESSAWEKWKKKLDKSMNKVADAMRETGNTADNIRRKIIMSEEEFRNMYNGAFEDDAKSDDFDETDIYPELTVKTEGK